jgi:hypothetical protein
MFHCALLYGWENCINLETYKYHKIIHARSLKRDLCPLYTPGYFPPRISHLGTYWILTSANGQVIRHLGIPLAGIAPMWQVTAPPQKSEAQKRT